MNRVILMGRLTRDPEVRYSQNGSNTCIARYTLAVDRRYKKDGEDSTDFIPCIAFGKLGELAEKYLKQGTKIAVVGHIQVGSYTNKDGQKVRTTDVIVDECEFAESKGSSGDNGNRNSNSNGNQNAPVQQAVPQSNSIGDGFMNIPDGMDAGLPFN